jgi:Thoeris protein ThsB, TIR-like domain
MGRKIFVSYKHDDNSVQPLRALGPTTARDYVDTLERIFQGDHIYKGEKNDEDLGSFKDETIASHLREKIFDSSVTIVLISKNMKEPWVSEDDQWIPWEISYSLREKSRDGRTSVSNAMLAVVIPDEFGSYSYFMENNPCQHCSSISYKTTEIFKILGGNMFNRKLQKLTTCYSDLCKRSLHTGNDHSYIHPVKWNDFLYDINGYIALATRINENIHEYDVVKVL